jgi:plastocyanin
MVGRLVVATAMAFLATACGSSSDTSPSPPVSGTTITITASGVNPKNLVVSPGTQVTFMNSDSRDHVMNSDPHPDHTDCTAINTVGMLAPGQSKQTGNLNTVRRCGYHDHALFTNTLLQGTITVQ